jgi:hypothetical protein
MRAKALAAGWSLNRRASRAAGGERLALLLLRRLGQLFGEQVGLRLRHARESPGEVGDLGEERALHDRSGQEFFAQLFDEVAEGGIALRRQVGVGGAQPVLDGVA